MLPLGRDTGLLLEPASMVRCQVLVSGRSAITLAKCFHIARPASACSFREPFPGFQSLSHPRRGIPIKTSSPRQGRREFRVPVGFQRLAPLIEEILKQDLPRPGSLVAVFALAAASSASV